MCRRVPGRAVLLPLPPSGRVTVTVPGCGLPSRSSPWMTAALRWLPTASRPTTASAAATCSASSPTGPRAASAASAARA